MLHAATEAGGLESRVGLAGQQKEKRVRLERKETGS